MTPLLVVLLIVAMLTLIGGFVLTKTLLWVGLVLLVLWLVGARFGTRGGR